MTARRIKLIKHKNKNMKRGRPQELKGLDTLIGYTDITHTTNDNTFSDVLNLVQAGTGSWNRVGRKVHPVSIRIRGMIRNITNTEATTGNQRGTILRLVLVHDHQPSGNAIPNFDDIFGTTDQAGLEQTNPWDGLRYDNSERFTVLRDKFIDLNPQRYAITGTENTLVSAYYCDEFINLRGDQIVYSGQSQPMSISDISTGAYYLYARVLVEDEVSTNVIANLTSRFRYTD